MTKGLSHTPQFLAINPGGRTPVLVDGDFTLSESNAIMQYIAGKKKNELWPENARTRADIACLQFWQAAHWHEGCGGFLWENLVKKLLVGGDPDPAALKHAEDVSVARDGLLVLAPAHPPVSLIPVSGCHSALCVSNSLIPEAPRRSTEFLQQKL